MQPALIAIAGPLTGATFDLVAEEVSIGRNPDNELCVPSKWVSRSHCQIRKEQDQLKIIDLKSSHGTFVNGIPVKERILEKGDRIGVGDCLFLYAMRETDAQMATLPADGRQLITKTASHLRFQDAPYLQLGSSPPIPLPDSRTAKDLGLLLRISSELSSLRSPHDVQQHVLRVALEAVPAERAAIILADAISGALTEVMALHRGAASAGATWVSAAIAAQVAQSHTSVLSNDLVDTTSGRGSRSLSDPNVQGVLCAPLCVSDRILGVLYLDTRDPGLRFDEGHLQLLTGIAGMGASALVNALHVERLEGEAQRLGAEMHLTESMVGVSPPMQRIHKFINKVAGTDATILIRGETGSGKELVARAIHANSPRAGKPFHAVSCGALTETLLESELFGHERGAFTGAFSQKKGRLEIADGGTFFLDEIGELAPRLQVKLLRVLQEREFEHVGGTRSLKVDIRLIAATNRDLEEAVTGGTFRKDLYYRINVVSLKMPPLRERREDIPLLASHFLAEYGARFGRQVLELSPEALECLMNYHWPGNVRELENAIERAVVLGSGGTICPEDLPESLLEVEPAGTAPMSTYHGAVRDLKRGLVLKALRDSRGSYTIAAKHLGIHRNYLHRLIRNLGLKTAVKE
jgi:Nif-specific regulatory protein